MSARAIVAANADADRTLAHLLANNRRWAAEMERARPGFFGQLAAQQAPRYLWIGCSDSRVPANEIVGLLPGELFVHRNVANVVGHTDFSCLSVLQYAIEVLRVEHVIVCGHYGCGGVAAALQNQPLGLIDNWLGHIRDVVTRHGSLLERTPDDRRLDLLCALNVLDQALHVCRSTVVRDAWRRAHGLTVHAWIYGLGDGLVRDLGFVVAAPGEADARHASALAALEHADGRADA